MVERKKSNTGLYLFPVMAVFMFSMFTLFLFVFGAWNYNVTNYGAVIALVVMCNVALVLGYYCILQRHNIIRLTERKIAQLEKIDNKNIELLKKWTFIATIIALPDMLYYSRTWELSFSQIIERLVMSFTQSNLNYSLSLNYEDSGTMFERIIVLTTVLLYFCKFAVLPLTMFYWHKVDRKQKVLCLYVTVVEMLKWLLMGMNKGLFDIVFVFVGATCAVIASKRLIGNLKTSSIYAKIKKYKRKIILLSFVLLIFAVLMFISNGRSRSGNAGQTRYYSTSMKLTADKNNVLLRFIPKNMHSAAISLDMYLTNGYQGLSYALQLPFEWCYGIGNNQFLISNFRDAFGLDVTNRSYLYRIEEVFPWEAAHNWHTAYTWFANDVSFIGLPVLFGVFGLIFAYSWIDTIERHNPYALMIFCLFIIRFAYLSANNQVTSSSFSFIAWYISFVFWYITRNGYKIVVKK